MENNYDKAIEEPKMNANEQNDIFNRGTKADNMISNIGMVVTILFIVWALRGAIMTLDTRYFLVSIVLLWWGYRFGKLFVNDTLVRKRCIKYGKRYAAVILNAEQYELPVKEGTKSGTRRREYRLRIKSIEDSEIYLLYGYNLDPNEYLENPYCNIYIYGKKIIASDFKVKDKYISKDGYLIKKGNQI